MSNKITLLLVDDHPMVRDGLRSMLSDEPDIEVVGEACTGEDAILKVNELGPQVVLMDIHLPGISGTEATRQVKIARPTTCVIMVTMYDSEMYVVEAIRAGAAGYLTKDVSKELLCHSVRAVADGGTMVRSELLRRAIVGLLRPQKNECMSSNPSLADRLTAREIDILRLLAQGHRNKAISANLNLAEITVKKHVQSLIGKLGVSDRTNAALMGARLGLVP